jgi:cytoskeletal protein CcmA (bactofilin family)
MILEGDSETDGSLRVEGTIRGNVRAGKSVVIGKDGLVDGSIFTQDAVVAGRVSGGIHAASRLELLATSDVSGEIEALRMQVEEGAKVQGQVAVGESSGAFKVPQAQIPSGGGGAEPGPEREDPEAEDPEPEELEQEGLEAAQRESGELEPGGPESGDAEPKELEAAQPEGSRD